jgi:hypothetical protein
MNKIIAAILLALVAIIIAGLVYAPKRHTPVGSLEATVECKDGHKWIRNRDGKLIEWITANGTKPPC